MSKFGCTCRPTSLKSSGRQALEDEKKPPQGWPEVAFGEAEGCLCLAQHRNFSGLELRLAVARPLDGVAQYPGIDRLPFVKAIPALEGV